MISIFYYSDNYKSFYLNNLELVNFPNVPREVVIYYY